jgi:hypothetical protein
MTRGTIFEHKHWLDSKNMPLLCVVTAVRHGDVHWKQWENGKVYGPPYRFAIDRIDRYVKQILEAA